MEQKTASPGTPAIKAKSVFIQIVVQMFISYRSLMSTE